MTNVRNGAGRFKIVTQFLIVALTLITLPQAQTRAGHWEEDQSHDIDVGIGSANDGENIVLPDTNYYWEPGFAQVSASTGFDSVDCCDWPGDTVSMSALVRISAADTYSWIGLDTSIGGVAYYSCDAYGYAEGSVHSNDPCGMRAGAGATFDSEVGDLYESITAGAWAEVDGASSYFEADWYPQDRANGNSSNAESYCYAWAEWIVEVSPQYNQIYAGTTYFGIGAIEVEAYAGAYMGTHLTGSGECGSFASSSASWDIAFTQF